MSEIANKLVALVHLVRDLGMVRDPEEIYEPALSALRAIIGVERSSILLLDDRGVARFVASRGLSAEYRLAVEGHFPWALDDPDPQPMLIEDVEGEPSLAGLLPTLRGEDIRAVAFIPLIYRDRLVGKFMLYYDRRHSFVMEEVELANAIAYLIAFAIERARLYAALAESDRRKDVFLATLSHELRNPLAPATAATAILADPSTDPATSRKSHEILDRSLTQMAKLVDDLLDVSRITRGVIAIEKRPVDLTSAVHHAVVPVQTLIASQHQVLTLALEPLWLEADPLRLEQVITNLVHNAAKYTPPGGHIWVTTRASNGGIEIRVRDDGIGIAADAVPRLFDLFVQVDKSLARTRGGLGIGLTIVRRLVELHGGTIRASSEGEGRGSEFVVVLPGRIDATRPTVEAREPARGTGQQILVVDDNEDAATTLALLLERRGHQVSVECDGPRALRAVAERHPAILLLDLGLPGMSGYEVARQLRAAGEHDLRIVAISGYGRPEDIAETRTAGFDAHLVKPVDLATLERVIANVGLPSGSPTSST